VHRLDSLSKSSIYAALRSHRMTSGGKELGYTGGVESSLCQSKGGTQTCSSSTDHNSIILMVLSQISSGFRPVLGGGDVQ
jgi:hypothetical protein